MASVRTGPELMAPVTRAFRGPAQALRGAPVCGGLWCHLVSTSGNSKWWCLGQGGTLFLWAFLLEKTVALNRGTGTACSV